MKILSGLFGSIILLLALAFALSNRQLATISLWPFGIEIQAPLCLLTLGTLLFGILLGATIMWFNTVPHRWKSRRMQKDLDNLQDKVTDLQQTVIPPSNRRSDDDYLLEGPPKRRLWRGGL